MLDLVDFDSDNEVRTSLIDAQPQTSPLDSSPIQAEQTSPDALGENPTTEEAGEDDEDSVYVKDNVVMRRIQIEGEQEEYLMDPEGNIYDIQGNFIGTANTQEIEEMGE